MSAPQVIGIGSVRVSDDVEKIKDVSLEAEEMLEFIELTRRCFDVVIRYDVDCPKGTRWDQEALREIFNEGRHLEKGYDEIKSLREEVARNGDPKKTVGEKMMEKICLLVDDCFKIRDLIKEREKLPEGWGEEHHNHDHDHDHDHGHNRNRNRNSKSNRNRNQNRNRNARARDTYRPAPYSMPANRGRERRRF